MKDRSKGNEADNDRPTVCIKLVRRVFADKISTFQAENNLLPIEHKGSRKGSVFTRDHFVIDRVNNCKRYQKKTKTWPGWT